MFVLLLAKTLWGGDARITQVDILKDLSTIRLSSFSWEHQKF